MSVAPLGVAAALLAVDAAALGNACVTRKITAQVGPLKYPASTPRLPREYPASAL